jgi:hypothetical protein
METNKLSSWLRWFALAPAGFFCGLWLIFGAGEVAGGDISGVTHLAPAVLIIILVILAWKWTRAGGIGMLLTGIGILIYLLASIQNPQARLPGAILTGGPFLFSGLLFLLAGIFRRP